MIKKAISLPYFEEKCILPTCVGSNMFRDMIDKTLAARDRENINPSIMNNFEMYSP